MYLQYLEEYITVAKYMSISKAAAKLNMTHSTLSKHIKSLEGFFGVDLISHGSRIELTTAGMYLLDCAIKIADYINDAKEEAIRISEQDYKPFVFREPTYLDKAAFIVFELLERYKDIHPRIPTKIKGSRYARPEDLLDDEVIDAQIVYRCDKSQDFVEGSYAGYKICDDQLGAWISKGSELAQRSFIPIESLDGLHILESNQIFGSMKMAIIGMFEKHNMVPVFEYHTIDSFSEMMTFRSPDSVRLFPYSIKDDPRLRTISDMTFRPVGIKSDVFSAFLLMKNTDVAQKTSQLFQQQVLMNPEFRSFN